MAITAGSEDPCTILLIRIGLRVEHPRQRQIGRVQLRVLGMNMEDRLAKNSDSRNWIDTLPEHVARVVVASNSRTCQRTQSQHCLGAIHDNPRMHLHRDLYSVLRSEPSVLYPVWRDYLVPLPFQNFAIVGG